MASSDSQINIPQHGHPKRAELPDVSINTGAQSINTERAFLNPSVTVHRWDDLIIDGLLSGQWLRRMATGGRNSSL